MRFRLTKQKNIQRLLKEMRKASAPNVPAVITHKEAGTLRNRIAKEPYFQCGSTSSEPKRAWWRRLVLLEFPCGEIAETALKTIALIGASPYRLMRLTGKERFSAQGLEGKVQVQKPLFSALMNLDLLPQFRGRILTKERKVIL